MGRIDAATSVPISVIMHRLRLFLFLPLIACAQTPLADFKHIVIADKPSLVEKAAEEELQRCVGLIGGSKPEYLKASEYSFSKPAGRCFFVGTAAAKTALGADPAPWKTEEHLLKTVRDGLVLAGDDDAKGDPWSSQTRAGTMLAVYTLLQDYFGVHWFWPGEFGEHVPHDPNAVVPALDLRQTPAFEIRSVQLGYFSYHTKAFSDAGRKWARRNRLSWVRSAVFGHSWDGAFDLRKGESFKQHPEWFALVNGQRKPPQMCTTNPDVIARMTGYVLKGKSDIMNISPSDGGGFCECERCRALDVPGVMSYDGVHVQLSDRIFTYANEVARRVREANPAKGCGMFAYTFYNKPPVKIAKLEPNLYLSFVFQSAAQRDPDNLRDWRENVSGWQKLGAKMIVREGWGNHYYHDMLVLHSNQVIANLAEASALGFSGAYGEGSKSFATQAPNYWAITHMMWNPKRDTAHLMRDFYEAAYGPAADEMQAFFETYEHALDANWSKRDRVVDTNQIAYANLINAWHKLLPPETIDAAEKHLQAAAAKAPHGEYADRVRFHRFGHDYTKIMLGLLWDYHQLGALGANIGFSVPDAKGDAKANAAKIDELLHHAHDLGERREAMLLEHRDWAGPDEGLYAFTVDSGNRPWHANVKKLLGIDKPSELSKAKLARP